MFMVSFLFRPGRYDDEFHRLNAETQAIAESTPGYLGSESWWSDDRSVRNAVYYWDDLGHLSDFSRAVPHLEAKSRYDRWYDGYQIVISDIRDAYGDGRLPHLTSPIAKVRRPPGPRHG